VDVGLVATVVVGEKVGASAANTGRSARKDQARVPPMRMARRPRATTATEWLRRWCDADAVDVDGGGGLRGTGEVTRRRAQRSAA